MQRNVSEEWRWWLEELATALARIRREAENATVLLSATGEDVLLACAEAIQSPAFLSRLLQK